MKVKFRRRSQVTRMVLLAGLCFSSLFLPVRASASLGGDVTSVEADQQQMNAKRAVQANGKYSVHEITTPYGTVVREYVSPDGKVFGVAWRGPFLPNFQQILGAYYGKFVQGAQDARTATAQALAQRSADSGTTGAGGAFGRTYARLCRARLRPGDDPAGR